MVTSIFINLKFVNHSLQIKSAKDGEAGTVEQILNMVENHNIIYVDPEKVQT